MNENMTPADFKAVLDANNGNSGVAYPYPVFPYYGGGFGGNSGFGNSSDWVWIILLLALFGGFNGNGNGGFGGFNNDYAWLSNGQKEIMQNTNDGFNTLQLANQLTGLNNSVQGISTQLCNCCGDISQQLCSEFAGVNATVNSGFANAETSANARQMANMQQAFNNAMNVQQGFNQIGSDLASCCCENRLATQDLKSTVISENCQDREVLREIGQNILVNQTANTQKIIDEIFRDRLDEKNDKIADLQRQLQMADLKASQIAQTAQIREGQVQEIDQMYQRLRDCPVRNSPCVWQSADFQLSKQ